MAQPLPGSLAFLGWDPFFESHYNQITIPGVIPCRVTEEFRESYHINTGQQELPAAISGRMRYTSNDYPAVGDWVAAVPYPDGTQAVIHAVLPRKSSFTRRAAGKAAEQVVAANIDTVFIVTALDGYNFNPRRLERYLTMAWKSGASPVFVLNKADLCPDTGSFIKETEQIAMGIPVYAVSATEKTGLVQLSNHIESGRTAAFLGSSGVGKSALINALLGSERLLTRATSELENKGRHTTTRRMLLPLPEGGMVIDTPGMKELGMWGSDDDIDNSFEDIESLAENCRFKDCRHDAEPGCAVREAIENGELTIARFKNYLKLRRELEFASAREDMSLRKVEQLRWKKIAGSVKNIEKNKYR